MNTRKKFSAILSVGIGWFVAVISLTPTAYAETGKRVALLIGNGDYRDGRLLSGKNNAMAMKPVLEQIGFEVKAVPDANLGTMREELKTFGDSIVDASAVLFFYSGHGFQLQGESYLLPVGGSPQKDRSLPLQEVLDTLALARASDGVKLMILDACRSKAGIEESQQGWAKPPATPKGVVQAFATLPGQVASSGENKNRIKNLSPYTRALLAHLRKPGISLKEFFFDVRNHVISNPDPGQSPQYPTTEGLDKAPDFLLSEPARVEAEVTLADDDLIVLLNGELALNHQAYQAKEAIPQEVFRKDLRLKSGDNKLTLLVSNQQTLRHGLPWERTNGWEYELRLIGPGDKPLTSPECGGKDPCFSGGEKVPFKDGPHHGKTFVVATANLYVDPTSGMYPRVSLRDVKNNLWKNSEDGEISSKIPFWAKDQELLYAVSLTKLPLGVAIAGNLQEIFEMIVKNVLEVQKNVPDPNKIYNVVRGNAALQEFVAPCIEGPDYCDARMKDFKQSLDAARKGDPKPFDGFVERLTECIRDRAAQKPGFTIPREDIRVWTAFEDWTSEPNQPPNPGFSGGQSCLDGPLPAESQDALVQIPAHGLRIGPHAFTATVRGVPLALRASAFVNFKPAEKDQFLLSARVVADLSDLQKKVSTIIDTIPLPSDNCARLAADNLVPRISGKSITIEGEVATLRVAGELEVWACEIAPHCKLFGCRDVMKTKLEATFDLQIPVRSAVAASNEVAFILEDPRVEIRGKRSVDRLAEGFLRAVGVDIEGKAKAALMHAIGPDLLKVPLPAELQRLDPTFTRAGFFNNSGALATSLEMTAAADVKGLLGLIKLFKPAWEGGP